MTCEYAHLKFKCPGCSLWGISYGQQLIDKSIYLKTLFPELKEHEVKTHSAGEYQLRHRFDFIIKNSKIGLIGKNYNESSASSLTEKYFIEINKCLQLAPELQRALELLKNIPISINLGSIRIRYSSLNKKFKYGIWLDFSNEDIKRLLQEKTTLIELSKQFFIEVGQKKKTLDPSTFSSPQIKLAEPKPQHWFYTKDSSNLNIPLNCAVSSFTQPSPETASLITSIILNWLSTSSTQNIWEFGCGIGQYTFPLLSLKQKVSVFENDKFSLECLERTAKENNYLEKLTIYPGDFQNYAPDIDEKPQVILVNPPKSGLKQFTNAIIKNKPQKIIYVSCYPESLKLDAEVFLQNDYKISEAHIVDQFPQTKHFEVVMLFEIST